MPQIEILTPQETPTGYSVELAPIGDGIVEWRMPEAFVGKDVVEELPESALRNLVDHNQRFDDVLGLMLEPQDDEYVRITVGLGSGNVRCLLRRGDLKEAVHELLA